MKLCVDAAFIHLYHISSSSYDRLMLLRNSHFFFSRPTQRQRTKPCHAGETPFTLTMKTRHELKQRAIPPQRAEPFQSHSRAANDEVGRHKFIDMRSLRFRVALFFFLEQYRKHLNRGIQPELVSPNPSLHTSNPNTRLPIISICSVRIRRELLTPYCEDISNNLKIFSSTLRSSW
jgi:hypothetical protein